MIEQVISDTLTTRAAAYWLAGLILGLVVVLVVRRLR